MTTIMSPDMVTMMSAWPLRFGTLILDPLNLSAGQALIHLTVLPAHLHLQDWGHHSVLDA